GDVALRLPAPDGRPLDVERGLLSLLPLARRGLAPGALLEHAQPVLGGGLVLAGLGGPEQAHAAGPVWPGIATAFGALDTADVIVDAGRLDLRSPVLPVVTSADLAVCVLDASLPGVYAARARLRTVLPELTRADRGGPRVGFVVRAGHRRDADGAAAALGEEFSQLEYLGHLPEDPSGARIFDGHPVARPERTLLVRAGSELVAKLGGLLWALGWAAVTAAREDEPEPVAASGAHRGGGRRRRKVKEKA
ncbi:MAG TPA: hypothetical protein VHC23_07930, partial [Jatrophihabitans sp.]|nr:hypothetical protein [Jatrophihabitans sp.]